MGSKDELMDFGGEVAVGGRNPSRRRSSAAKSARAAPFSALIGLMFTVVALIVLIESSWIDIDVMLIAGILVAASGVAMFAAVAFRHRRRRNDQNF